MYTIEAESPGQGFYLIDVPNRDDVIDGIDEREEEIKDKLDLSMAQAIYENVYDLPAVRTQLNPILQILRWTRKRDELTIERVNRNQRSDKSKDYIDLLESFGYIEVEDRNITPGIRIRTADLN